MQKVTIEKSRGMNGYTFVIGDRRCNLSMAANTLDVPRATLYHVVKRYEGSPDKIVKWIEDVLWRRENGFSHQTTVYTSPAGCKLAVPIVAKETGYCDCICRVKLSKWRKGEIDDDTLFFPKFMSRGGGRKPKGKKKVGPTSEWVRMGGYDETGREREKKLKSIPSPTKYERGMGHVPDVSKITTTGIRI